MNNCSFGWIPLHLVSYQHGGIGQESSSTTMVAQTGHEYLKDNPGFTRYEKLVTFSALVIAAGATCLLHKLAYRVFFIDLLGADLKTARKSISKIEGPYSKAYLVTKFLMFLDQNGIGRGGRACLCSPSFPQPISPRVTSESSYPGCLVYYSLQGSSFP